MPKKPTPSKPAASKPASPRRSPAPRKPAAPRSPSSPSPVHTITHKDTRPNIPTEELRDFVREDAAGQKKAVLYPRNPDLDPQLVWKGKDEQDAAPGGLGVPCVPIFIQEKIHPQAIIDDFRRTAPKPPGSESRATQEPFLFAPYAAFNGLPEDFSARVDF